MKLIPKRLTSLIQKISRYQVFFVLILALALRLIFVNQPLWLDEATSGLVVRNLSSSQIITQFSPADFHPPLYYLILKIWSIPFGTSEIALRSLSILAGILTVYFVYLIGNQLGETSVKKKVGVWASLFLATSGLHIYYSQEARMYALACFFIVLSVYFFNKILRLGKFVDWLGFSVTLTLSVFTDYLPLFMIPVFWIWAYLSKKNLKWWKSFLISHLLVFVCFIFWIPVLFKQLSLGMAVGSNAPVWWKILGLTSFKTIGLIPVKFVLGRISFTNKIIYGLISFVTVVVYAWIAVNKKSLINKSLRGMWLWFIIPILGSLVLGLKIPVLSYFRLLFVLPAFYLLLAYGLSRFKGYFLNLTLAFILVVNLSSSLFYLLNPRFHREDWRGLVNFIQKESQNENVITLFVANSQMEAYQYYAPDAKIAGPEGLDNGYDKIWLMRYVQPVFDSDDNLRKKVENLGYWKTGEYDFNGVTVWKYVKEK